MDGAGGTPNPGIFLFQTSFAKGCKSQDLDARKEQRWQEIPNQQKMQLVLGQTQRRKRRHKQRQRKALSRGQVCTRLLGISTTLPQQPGGGQELPPQSMISHQLSPWRQSGASGTWDQQLSPPTAALAKKNKNPSQAQQM